ncbi:hypothetical protein [Streptomyces oceani]|uniref:Uncharacterized protein n=1 Tax=Streptomyces oceani TaxID=1075402 RepID=A0A1E7KP56_9ACTN|nr:hypothetical protein [Streptomyces oceani]OEV05601.1 hypothetical protein AN216_02795 [Streptomyces oceani]
MSNSSDSSTRGTGHASARVLDTYGRGVRTALQDNATAYGFSISITAAYGLASGSRGPASAAETIGFALGAGTAFLVITLLFLSKHERLSEGEQVLTLSGAFDFLSVVVAVAVGYGLSRIPGSPAWPLTGLGTVVSYLLVGGLDVVLARALSRHTSLGRSDSP